MSVTAAQPLPAPLPATPEAAADASRPWLAQVMLDTVGRRGAQVGLIWIAIVAFFAVLAPFIANSHPYLLKTTDPLLKSKYGGTWSSPLLQHLGPADVILPLLAIAALALWL